MKLRSIYIFSIALLLAITCFPSTTLGQHAEEYALKASYINRFMHFVTWPEKDGVQSSSQLEICILGENPFDGDLEKVFVKQTDDDKEVKIKYISDIDEAANCDVLFVAESKKNEISDILEKVSDKQILTIGDTKGFFNAGVIITFYIESDRLKFKINLDAAKKSKIVFDPYLLDYAIIPDSSEVSSNAP